MLSNILDAFRITIVVVAFFFGYKISFTGGYHPAAQLHLMIPLVIIAIAGISGLEGLLFGKKAAEAKGFTSDRNYQRQTDLAMLSYTVVALIVCIFNWGLPAELTVFFAFICETQILRT